MIQSKMKYKLWEWLKQYGDNLPEGEKRYLLTSINVYGDNFASFCMTAKLHKLKPDTPMRPIVCCIGTLFNCWSI